LNKPCTNPIIKSMKIEIPAEAPTIFKSLEKQSAS